MRYKMIFLAAAFVAASVPAMANGPLAATATPAQVLSKGHGRPGDTAVASSDRDVSFRVLDNGYVERTNRRFGTVSINNPLAKARSSR